MQQRSVRDLMRIRHGLVVTETSTLREVAERLIISDCDLIAVTDAHGKLSGVVSEGSIVRALISNPASDAATIQSIIIRHAECVRLDADLSTVQPLFRSCANTAIPVVDANGHVCGLLMRSDVIRSLLNRDTESIEAEANKEVIAEAITDPTPALINPATAFTPPKKRTVHTGDAVSETKGNQSRPHFLRADAARRILWAAEDRL